ncbi:hypothetical protein [Marinobacter sp. F4206]|uniref:hypothetical protein n=1 Tax=Marinobacter sp. F4206 TaxID=2861777 RepID=UPI001C604079|nr:hypothetical protein [Marinobacter sp. F4206]MBW4933278.1 hypothetical protein [Marinobacter sp. F4206]
MNFKEHLLGAALGSIGTLLVMGAAYVYVIKDNTRELGYLADRLAKLESEQKVQLGSLEGALDESRKRIGKLNLFIVSVHPDKYSPNISSVEKFRDLSAAGLESFAQNVSDTLPVYEQVRASLDSVDEKRLDLLLEEFENGRQWEGGGVQRVARQLGIESSRFKDLQTNVELQDYLENNDMNAHDLNFALEVMSSEESPAEGDHLREKKDQVVERLLKESLSLDD